MSTKDRIDALKKKLLVGIMAVSGILPMSAKKNSKDVQKAEFGIEVSTGHAQTRDVDTNYRGFTSFKEIETFSNGKSRSESKHADANMYDLGDGYLMVSSSFSQYNSKNNHKPHIQRKHVQYMVTPSGETYDCSFIDTDKLIEINRGTAGNEAMLQYWQKKDNHAKKVMQVDSLTQQNIMDYNAKVTMMFMRQAKRKGFSEGAVRKVGTFLQQVQDDDLKIYEPHTAEVISRTSQYNYLAQNISR